MEKALSRSFSAAAVPLLLAGSEATTLATSVALSLALSLALTGPGES